MSSARGLLPAIRVRVDQLVAGAVEQGQAPGVVAAISIGDELHVATGGVTSLGGTPMTRDTIFRITSMTKPMTATAVLAQIDSGLLALDEPVERLLPELANRRVLRHPDGPLEDTVSAARPILVRDLLTFTWGFGMQGAMFTATEPWPIVAAAHHRNLSTFGPPQPDLTPEPDLWLQRLAELPLLAQPGERWLYQSGSQVLGVLAARVDGTSFPEVLRRRVFDPLGMRDTDFHTTQIDRLATAYEIRDGQFAVLDPPDGQWSRSPAFPDGGAGLLSTIDDVLTFGRMLCRGGSRVLSAATVREMTRDQLTATQRSNVWPGFNLLDDRGWGFGVSVSDDGTYGWDGGFGTTWSNVGDRLTVVVLTQRAFDHTGPPPICSQVLAAVRDM